MKPISTAATSHHCSRKSSHIFWTCSSVSLLELVVQTMSSSSLANWDGSQTRRNSKQPFGNSDVRTLSFGGPLASTSTETSNNNHTAAYFDASLTRTEDHQASWRTAEGNNQDVSSMARVFSFPFCCFLFFFFSFSFFLQFACLAGRVLSFFFTISDYSRNNYFNNNAPSCYQCRCKWRFFVLLCSSSV